MIGRLGRPIDTDPETRLRRIRDDTETTERALFSYGDLCRTANGPNSRTETHSGVRALISVWRFRPRWHVRDENYQRRRPSSHCRGQTRAHHVLVTHIRYRLLPIVVGEKNGVPVYKSGHMGFSNEKKQPVFFGCELATRRLDYHSMQMGKPTMP